ncbi:MAG: hypothetical protein FWD05_09760 [Oscillospiraceae bacterium]|nr:hypothetical protein [Oscillospiraceae bacterium]
MNEIELTKAIDNFAPKIIEKVNNFVKAFEKDIKNNGKRQFIELVEAAAHACCVDEFKLYIAYKGSKSGTEKLWTRAVVNLFNKTIDDLCKDIADQIKKDNELVRLAVIQRFCGYLMWRTSAIIGG